ncbi:tRNA-splicing endonuclease subunit Sen15 [Diplogelasinospora grovesii]|uniref:tRNA-splicing endonuclease subunit Sen15 n=1 Tax=Diplogelasinospora grovesii TaxID=303347 RepID=A0AAN6S938_9PEZI|nr:tRNA-splicing endonuclease subunit Sen15 [Diplogelasinospora grovesii]
MSCTHDLEALTKVVLNNLENQHDWTETKVHTQPDLPRQIIHGLPPKRLYVHPDEQIDIIRAEKARNGDRIPQPPELEWVLPLHIAEKWSPSRFAAVFDALAAIPPGGNSLAQDLALDSGDADAQWKLWRGPKRGKRLLLATVQDDSTVTYYFMHDGIVKPRQN